MTEQANAPATESKKKSLAEQLVEAEARVVTLKQRIAAEALINNVAVGDDVTFNYGRAEKKRELRGIVEGTKATDLGLQVLIVVGSGFDAERFKVFARDLTGNFTKNGDQSAPASQDDALAAAE